MGLMFNGDRLMPYSAYGATLMDGGNRMSQLANRETDGAFALAEQHFDARAGRPSGNVHPVAWVMPRKSGGLSARNTITGSGGVTSAATQSGFNIAATLTGSGGVSGPLGLIVTLAATIIGSGNVSSATVQALATLVATLSGSGSVTATAAGLADLAATLTGSGSVTANNTALMDLTAEIRGYGDLTPEGIRDAVWAAQQARINNPGTAGAALMAAGGAGDPWITPLPGTYPAGTAGHIVGNIVSGLTPTQAAQLLDIFRRLGLDPLAPLVTNENDGLITAGALSQTVVEAPEGVVTVTRTP